MLFRSATLQFIRWLANDPNLPTNESITWWYPVGSDPSPRVKKPHYLVGTATPSNILGHSARLLLVLTRLDKKSRRVVRLAPSKRIAHVSMPTVPLLGSCVFLAMAYPNTTEGMEEVVGQISAFDETVSTNDGAYSRQIWAGRFAGQVLVDTIGKAKKLDKQSLHDISGTSADVNRIDPIHNKKVVALSEPPNVDLGDNIRIIGLQILPDAVHWIGEQGIHRVIQITPSQIPTQNFSKGWDGFYIGQGTDAVPSWNDSAANERYIYEVRLYNNVAMSAGQMKLVWQEIQATHTN